MSPTRTVTVIDGGLSTALEELGADIDGPLWTAKVVANAPDLLARAHRAFVDAGSRIVTTASYQCGVGAIDMGATVAIARAAVGDRAAVAASVGPFGAGLADGSEYTGDYRVDGLPVDWATVERYHRDKISALLSAGPDLVAVETIPLAREAALIRRILEENGSPPAWFSFGCTTSGSGARCATYGGDSVERAVESVAGYGRLVAVGVNCSHPDDVTAALRRMHAAAPTVSLVAYPNHGRVWDATNRRWRGEGLPVPSGSILAEWLDLGVTHVGGCCGVGPDAIAELAGGLERLMAP